MFCWWNRATPSIKFTRNKSILSSKVCRYCSNCNRLALKRRCVKKIKIGNDKDKYQTYKKLAKNQTSETTQQVGYLQSGVWYFEEGGVVLWRVACGTLNRVVWYFEEGVWYFEECDTLKRVMWYFEVVDVVLWRGLCGIFKRVMWYFEEGCVLL